MRNFILFICCLTLFVSCSKSDSILDESTSDYKILQGNQILSFNSYEEVHSTLQKITFLTSDELKEYEESRGYKSFGRKCIEVYFSVEPEDFSSTEQVKEFVKKNNKYLELVPEGNGEYSLEMVLARVPERYIINEDKMFQVKDLVYKVFDIGMVATYAENIDILKTYTKEDFLQKGTTSDIFIVRRLGENSGLKDAANNCGTYKEDIGTVDNERVKAFIETFIDNPGGGATYGNIWFQMRPQRKFLFIWWNCGRHMTASWNYASDYAVQGIWDRISFGYSLSEYSTWLIERTHSWLIIAQEVYAEIHFADYAVWGWSPALHPYYDQWAKMSCPTSSIYPDL